jgi:hypothetical protein
MRRPGRRSIFLVSCIIFAAITAFIFWPGEREPAYQGKTLSEWLAINGKSNISAAEADKAVRAIQTMGTNALPSLLRWVDYEPSATRTKMDSLADKLPGWMRQTRLVRRFVIDRGIFNAEYARGGFGLLGEQAKPALPALVQKLRQTGSLERSERVAESMSYIGNDAFPPMLELLADKHLQANTRVAIVFALQGMVSLGSELRPAIPVLIQCLEETNESLVVESTRTLGSFALLPGLSVPALAKAVGSPHAPVRQSALRALSRFRQKALPGLPAVIKALDDSDPHVRTAATNAVVIIAPEMIESDGVHVEH